MVAANSAASSTGTASSIPWDEPWCNPFRDMLAKCTTASRRIVPYLNEILGKGFRIIFTEAVTRCSSTLTRWMDKGAEGHRFHGSSGLKTGKQGGGFDPNQYYIFNADGKMHNGLTVVSIQLTDVNRPGDGGLSLILPDADRTKAIIPAHSLTCACIKNTRNTSARSPVRQATQSSSPKPSHTAPCPGQRTIRGGQRSPATPPATWRMYAPTTYPNGQTNDNARSWNRPITRG